MEITVWGGPEINGEDLHKIGACLFQLLQDKKKDKGRDIYYLIQLRKKPITSVKKHKANYPAKCAKCYNVGHLI